LARGKSAEIDFNRARGKKELVLITVWNLKEVEANLTRLAGEKFIAFQREKGGTLKIPALH
jgi:hypothetical protein